MRRLGTCFDLPPDPQVEHVITLLCQVFQTSSALLALVESDRIYIRCAARDTVVHCRRLLCGASPRRSWNPCLTGYHVSSGSRLAVQRLLRCET